MRIVFYEANSYDKRFFERELVGHECIFYKETLTLDNVETAKDADVISIFISSKVDRNVIERIPSLKGIATRSTGTDHIDIVAAQEKNIIVKSVPTYGVNTVAEHTFALMLCLSRKVHQSILQTQKGDFSNHNLTGFDLAGKTLGIIGLGHIGERVAEIATSFKMKILVFTRTHKPLPNVEYVELEELLARADIITFHTPLTPTTLHLLNRNNIQLIKKKPLVINTARGGLIETEAIVKALKEGLVSGAALDVLEEEHAIKEETQILSEDYIELSSARTLLLDHLLLDMPNVIITPHNAFNSKEALREINQITLDNILSFK